MVNQALLSTINSVLGVGKKTSKGNYAYHCPFCHHYKPKMEINLVESDKNRALSSRQTSEKGKYMALVQEKIQRNWRVESSFSGKSCVVNIRLASNGLVIDAKPVEGDTQVCRSAIAAVRQANTLPVSKDPAVFAEFKDFNLRVSPP